MEPDCFVDRIELVLGHYFLMPEHGNLHKEQSVSPVERSIHFCGKCAAQFGIVQLPVNCGFFQIAWDKIPPSGFIQNFNYLFCA